MRVSGKRAILPGPGSTGGEYHARWGGQLGPAAATAAPAGAGTARMGRASTGGAGTYRQNPKRELGAPAAHRRCFGWRLLLFFLGWCGSAAKEHRSGISWTGPRILGAGRTLGDTIREGQAGRRYWSPFTGPLLGAQGAQSRGGAAGGGQTVFKAAFKTAPWVWRAGGAHSGLWQPTFLAASNTEPSIPRAGGGGLKTPIQGSLRRGWDGGARCTLRD